jgi:glycerophosphoryl diester phosphodiesterase
MIAYNGNNPEVFRQIAQLRPDLVNLHQPFEFVRVIQAGDSVNGA